MQLSYRGPLALPVTIYSPVSGRTVTYDGEGPLEVTAEEGGPLVESGEWAPVGEKPKTVADILADVGDDPAKAATALATETSRANPRTTLVEQLRGIAAAGADDQTAPPDPDGPPSTPTPEA